MSMSPKDKVLVLLRRLKRRIDTRDLTRVRKAFEGDQSPVLVHTCGKVGSTALHAAIEELPGFVPLHTHVISQKGVADARKIHAAHNQDPVHLRVGDAIREAMAEHPERKVYIVTLVREPVARAVSDLFENWTILTNEEDHDFRKLPLDRVVEIASNQVIKNIQYMENWFDQEIREVFDIDVFLEAFDRDLGFGTLSTGRYSLLSGKLESLSSSGGDMLGDFLGRGSAVDIPRKRERSATGQADLYTRVRDELSLPESVLDEVYGSRLCRHFYSGEELGAFRSNWLKN